MKTILVPTDFSEYAGYASDFAAQLSRHTGAELCFIHVVEIPSSPEAEYYLNHMLIQNMMTEAEEKLQLISKKYKDINDVKTFVTTSNAINGIKSGILSMQADLIVMGKHHHGGGISELLFDNNTEKIIRYANCPVFSICEPVDFDVWKKAVVAIDPEACHSELLEDVRILSDEMDIIPHFVWIAKNQATHSLENIDLLKDSLKSHFASRKFMFSSTVSTQTDEGIIKFSKELNADLIILSTHARRGFNRLIHGSVTESVVEKANIPTLVVQLNPEIKGTGLSSEVPTNNLL